VLPGETALIIVNVVVVLAGVTVMDLEAL